MNKLLAASLVLALGAGSAVAQETTPGGAPAGPGGPEAATNLPLTVGIAVGTAALIGVAVNAAAGDDDTDTTTTTTTTSTTSTTTATR